MLKMLKDKEMSLVNFKATRKEREQMQQKAARFTNGNLSEWIRYAATTHEPPPSELSEPELELN